MPDELPTGLERKRWLELNRIICEVCEPRISRRKISTAAELAGALHNLQRGKRRRSSGLSIWATTVVLFGFAGWASWVGLKDSVLMPWNKPAPPRAVVAEGLLRVVTTPEGAEVYDSEETLVGITPTSTIRAKVGSELSFVVRKKGYRTLEITATVTEESISGPHAGFWRATEFFPRLCLERNGRIN